MSPMKYQRLLDQINNLDLPAERVQALRGDLEVLRCGLAFDGIELLLGALTGNGGLVAKYLVSTS